MKASNLQSVSVNLALMSVVVAYATVVAAKPIRHSEPDYSSLDAVIAAELKASTRRAP